MKTIILNVPQGIGDAFWIYQKFAPHVDQINFNVMCYGAGDMTIQARAVPWLKILPQVGEVKPIQVEPARYERVWRSYFPMSSIFARFAKGWAEFDYGCNRPLEQGTRIEKIDPYLVRENVPLPEEEFKVCESAYAALYISGVAAHTWAIERGMWPVSFWVDLVRGIWRRYKLSLPIAVIGASYDAPAVQDAVWKLDNAGFSASQFIDLAPKKVIYLLRKSAFFLGHQSGLNILANNLNVRQLMMYMPTLDRLRWSWPKESQIKSGRYSASLFSDRPDEVIQQLKWGEIA